LYPITSELAFHDRLTLYDVTVPTPASGSGVPELDALLASEREPETVPLACGVKATLNETLWPAAIVTGKEAPLSAN